MEVQIKQITDAITNLRNKNFTFYFFTLDTKGNPTAGIANIYEHVKVLTDLGYNACILHEKNDYKLRGDANGQGLAEWLGDEYAKLPHVSVESQTLKVTPQDFIVIPEIFANIMDQVKQFPCKKIVLSQSYDYLLELLPLGKRWNTDYGFNDVITTSERQAEYLRSLFPSIKTYVVPVAIPAYFKPSDKPKQPIITILTREQGNAAKIAKAFYLKNPIYKWITFKELRGLPREEFASELANSCLAIWLDDGAGFGTFPLEAMQCGTSVIGKIPNLIPEWLEGKDKDGNSIIRNNGIWTNTNINIPDLIATFMIHWLEDSIPVELVEGMKESSFNYTSEKQKPILEAVYSDLVESRINELNNILETTKQN